MARAIQTRPPQGRETSQVRFGRTLLEYGIQRSPRRKTVALSVDPEDGVLLTAPETVSIDRLDKVVRAKAPWILERLRWIEAPEAPPAPREFTSGETFLYLGRQYRLRFERRSADVGVRMVGGFLVVTGEGSSRVPGRPARIRRAVEAWYRDRASERLSERVTAWARRLDVDHTGNVLVRSQQKRWASCDVTGSLRFNWRIIQAPLRLVDYVVAHELVHLVHRDHTSDFWTRLGRAMTDYEARREALRRLGPRLEW